MFYQHDFCGTKIRRKMFYQLTPIKPFCVIFVGQKSGDKRFALLF
jgi:hypothetical protein